jgi:nitronate monooxygenase
LKGLTSKPVNVNFFCHAQAKADADREHAWHDRLSPYYRELGIDHEPPLSRLDIAPLGDATCTVVEDAKPEVVMLARDFPHRGLQQCGGLQQCDCLAARYIGAGAANR